MLTRHLRCLMPPTVRSPAFRSGVRCVATAREIQLFEKIPGLALLPDYITEAESALLIENARRISRAAHDESDGKRPVASTAHNVNQKEEFVRVSLKEEGSDGVMNAEHFSKYGAGHNLTYFRGQLPSFGLAHDLQTRLADLPAFRDDEHLAGRHDPTAPLRWKLTLNRYDAAEGNAERAERAGFPWHVDLHANGAVTAILGLGAPGVLEFAAPPTPTHDGMVYDEESGKTADHGSAVGDEHPVLARIVVPPRGLLVLSGRARWEFLHRVAQTTGEAALKERLSLVYGCW